MTLPYTLPLTRETVNRHFKVARQLGNGAYGTTTLLTDELNNTIVSKRIDVASFSDVERMLCMNEIKLIANINHPFIVKYLGSYLEGNVLYILTQYCKGGDLHRYIAQKRKANEPIREERITKWLAQLLSALKYLHKHHILHRDLKSLNVLIDSDKSLKLCDFGVSKVLNATADHTRTVIGTPYYFSPELINGQEYSWPSDIWALGCLTYELATFKTPFDGAKGMQQLVKHIKTSPIPDLPRNYSPELNSLFKSMMFHDARFRLSASELLATEIMQKALRQMLKEAEHNVAPQLIDSMPNNPFQSECISSQNDSCELGLFCCGSSSTCVGVAAKIELMKPHTIPSESRSCPAFPSHDAIILHCVRLASAHLGIDVTGLDLQGELDASNFGYLTTETVTGGITNILFKVTNTKNGKIVAVRIFGHKTDQFIDRSNERIIQSHLCLQGLAKKVYARFNGGQIEEWLPGEALSDADFQSYKYSHLIARQLHKLHTTPGQKALYQKLHPHLAVDGKVKFESQLWPSVWKFYNLCIANMEVLEPIIGGQFNLFEIKKCIEKLSAICDVKKSEVVLSHCDLLNGNVIIVSADEAVFLDYEYACFMERGFDIANHFIEHCGIECNWDHLPDETVQRGFLRHYLGDRATEDQVSKLYDEIQPYFVASNLFWGLWGLLQCMYSTHDVDFQHYARSRIMCAINDERWHLFK
ncbi:Serine/threonine-protein kinase Nek4 [Babesia sp. Xinjiang]|uniref:Serine/threonine-protein kinase Nek4 n=1 Tax=Babesia sp. Xinjiang TaxID=462227 RepID=UPI000A24FDEB|nr:Serine/threonine-protein kinase Nek4 [Babesia sp. Xinjiang]ORM42014.1 Serine/threonine-protein kinase Nek4 [Babesia sp. Xinjiang]